MRTRGQRRLRARLGWSPPKTLAVRLWTCARVLPVAGCTWSQGMDSQQVTGLDTKTEPPLASPHACCFVTWLLRCTHRMHSCFLLVAMPLLCPALPLYPGLPNGPPPVAVANANAHKSTLPPSPQSLVGRYPRSSRCSVMLWATSRSPGTHGIEEGRNRCQCEMPGNSSRRHDKWL